jgi:hypothetical protein
VTLWKQILLKSLGVGVGIGVGVAISVGVYAWYASRPKPQKPWDAKAISAKFEHADTKGEDHHLTFLYSMENHTDLDYKIETANLRVSAVIAPEDSLFGGTGEVKFGDASVFLPAKQRVLITLELPNYTYRGAEVLLHDTSEDRKKYRDAVQKYVDDASPRLNGFAAFDEINRYRINFPNGWRQTKN